MKFDSLCPMYIKSETEPIISIDYTIVIKESLCMPLEIQKISQWLPTLSLSLVLLCHDSAVCVQEVATWRISSNLKCSYGPWWWELSIPLHYLKNNKRTHLCIICNNFSTCSCSRHIAVKNVDNWSQHNSLRNWFGQSDTKVNIALQ